MTCWKTASSAEVLRLIRFIPDDLPSGDVRQFQG